MRLVFTSTDTKDAYGIPKVIALDKEYELIKFLFNTFCFTKKEQKFSLRIYLNKALKKLKHEVTLGKRITIK